MVISSEAVEAETQRLLALFDLELVEDEKDPQYDDLVALAAAVCQTPASAISFVGAQHQWFRAAEGLPFRTTSRSIAICDHAIRQTDIFEVSDLKRDERFTTNPLVTAPVPLRFYAGYPLHIESGHAVGTLCVIDYSPRVLTDEQRFALRVLAKQASALLDLRAKTRRLERALRDVESAHIKNLNLRERFQSFMDSGPFLSYMKAATGEMLYYSQPLANHFGVSRTELLGKTDFELWPTDLATEYRDHDVHVLESGTIQVVDESTRNPDGSMSRWRSYKFPCRTEAGELCLGGISVEIT